MPWMAKAERKPRLYKITTGWACTGIGGDGMSYRGIGESVFAAYIDWLYRAWPRT